MKVSIEKRDIAGGKQSLRLVSYYGSTTDKGKVTHQRKRETLDLFLYTKPKTPIEKDSKINNKSSIYQIIYTCRRKIPIGTEISGMNTFFFV